MGLFNKFFQNKSKLTTKMGIVSKDRLFYKNLITLENTGKHVPKGEVWEIVAFFEYKNTPPREVLQEACFHFNDFRKSDNDPSFSPNVDFNTLFSPPLRFSSFWVNEEEQVSIKPLNGFYIVCVYEILALGIDKQKEYWRRYS